MTWRSSDPSVVQVDPTIGLATAVSEGNAIVIAQSGSVLGQASVAVEIIECTEPFDVTLVPGQTQVTEPRASATCALRLPAGNPGDRYRVAVVSLRTAQNTPVVTASLTLTPQGTVTASAPRLRTAAPPPLLNARQMALLEGSARVAEATARVHERLRASEEEMLRRLGPSATTRFPIAAAPAGPFLVSPARKTFIASADGKCSLEGKTPVTGLLVAQSATIAVYQDSVQQAQFQSVSVDNVQRILDFFTAYGTSTIESYFGAIPDRDNNDQVVVLVTPRRKRERSCVRMGWRPARRRLRGRRVRRVQPDGVGLLQRHPHQRHQQGQFSGFRNPRPRSQARGLLQPTHQRRRPLQYSPHLDGGGNRGDSVGDRFPKSVGRRWGAASERGP